MVTDFLNVGTVLLTHNERWAEMNTTTCLVLNKLHRVAVVCKGSITCLVREEQNEANLR